MWPCTFHPEVESGCPPAPAGESRLGPAEAGEHHAGGAQTWPFTEDLEGRFGPTVCFTRSCLGLGEAALVSTGQLQRTDSVPLESSSEG